MNEKGIARCGGVRHEQLERLVHAAEVERVDGDEAIGEEKATISGPRRGVQVIDWMSCGSDTET